MKLTPKSCAALVLPAGKTDAIFFDDAVPGFGLRMRASGSKMYVYQYEVGGRTRRLTLGAASALSVDKARSIAADLHAKVRLGGDPAADKVAARAASALTFKAIADRFMNEAVPRRRGDAEQVFAPRTKVQMKRHLDRDADSLHRLPISKIDKSTVAALVGKVASRCGDATANRFRTTLSSMFSWAIGEGLISVNPVNDTNSRPEQTRDRVLRSDELVAVWNACTPSSDFGDIVRLLALTGLRRTEVGELRWSEVDLDRRMIELPAARTKNGTAHVVPMAPAVAAILAARTRTPGRDYVFGSKADRPFGGWSKAKTMLDAEIAAALGKPFDKEWRLHDLRRTAATRMAEIGVQPHIIEALLNHQSGHKRGVAGIYNRATYLPEKTAALIMWADHVAALVDGRDRRVVPLRQGGAA